MTAPTSGADKKRQAVAQDEPTVPGASVALGTDPQSVAPPVWGPPPVHPAWGYEPAGPSSYGLPGPEPFVLWGGVGVRLGALVLDVIVMVVALFAMGMVIAAVSPAGKTSDSESPIATAMGLIWIVFALVYHPVCWYVVGGTLGQKALGLRIARAYDGADMDIGRVLVRYLIFFFVTVIVPMGVISAVMTAQDPFKRAWHDQVARTIVVKRR
jgi:uncharacterized RDD family membrane protein YckC